MKFIFPLAIVFFLTAPQALHAAPKAELWPKWQNSTSTSSTQTVDHSDWDEFLSAYVVVSSDGINRVDYSSVSRGDKQSLESYLGYLQSIRPTELDVKEQLSYWINLYNALTVKVILDHYPVESIRDIDISPGFFSDGPWGKKLLTVENEKISLDDIEHRILRPIWKDPRIHYAVNCASIGCPNLAEKAYRAGNTAELLDKGAKAYINHPRGARVENGRLYVSSIYEWFQQDFGGTDQGVIKHLLKYAGPKLAGELKAVNRISDDSYDWSLNDAQ